MSRTLNAYVGAPALWANATCTARKVVILKIVEVSVALVRKRRRSTQRYYYLLSGHDIRGYSCQLVGKAKEVAEGADHHFSIGVKTPVIQQSRRLFVRVE